MRKGNELKENYGTQTVYDIDDFPVYLRLKNLHRIPGQATTLHWHEDVEYILAIKGTVKCHVDGQAIFIKAGEGLFINARQPHVFCAGDEKENLIQLVQILPSYMEALPAVKEKYIDKITENAAMPWLKTGNPVAEGDPACSEDPAGLVCFPGCSASDRIRVFRNMGASL